MSSKEPVSDSDLLLLMSKIISLREQVAQAKLRAHQLKRNERPTFRTWTRRRAQKRR